MIIVWSLCMFTWDETYILGINLLLKNCTFVITIVLKALPKLLKMKRGKFILMFFILLLVVVSVKSQTVKERNVAPDKRISEAFGEQFVLELKSDNQEMIMYYNFYLDNAYYITELPVDKSDFLNSLVSLNINPLSTKDKINILMLDMKLNFEKETYYRIENSQKVMVFYSGKDLTEKYNEYKNSKGLINNSLIK